MAKQLMRVEGLKELDMALQALAEEFSERNAKNVLRGALKDGGEVFAAEARSLVPDDPRTGAPDLKSSIGVGAVLSQRQKRVTRKESAIEVYAGAGPRPYAHLQEFGTAHHGPQPFLRPAFDNSWRGVLAMIVTRTRERLADTVARLSRKAERDAAKMLSGQ